LIKIKITRILNDDEVKKTLERITNWRWKYSQDWTTFYNDWRQNWERLPIMTDTSYYKEWTVDTSWISGRWPRRIVIWKNWEKFFTDDHYMNFIRIN
jgi:guanyl-specific ribonuclease Sa